MTHPLPRPASPSPLTATPGMHRSISSWVNTDDWQYAHQTDNTASVSLIEKSAHHLRISGLQIRHSRN